MVSSAAPAYALSSAAGRLGAHPSTTLRADGMAYDNLARVVELKGRMTAVFAPAGGVR